MIKDKINKKILFLFACVFNLILIFILNRTYNFVYYLNDDQYLNLIAEKAFGGITTGLVCMNIWLTSLLSLLYSVIPSLNWYVIVLYGIMFLGWIVITYVFLNKVIKSKSIILALFSFFLIISYASYGYRYFNFTQIAMISIVAGFILLIFNCKEQTDYVLENNEKSPSALLQNIVAILLVFVGVGVRYECIFAIAPLFGLYIIYSYFSTAKGLKYGIKEAIFNFFGLSKKSKAMSLQLKYIILIIGALLLSFASIIADNIWYKSDTDWKNFKEFNKFRAKLYDYQLFDTQNTANADDYKLFFNGAYGLNGFMVDTEVYNPSSLKKWVSEDSRKPSLSNMVSTWSNTTKQYLQNVSVKQYFLLLILIAIFFAIFNKKKGLFALLLFYYLLINIILLFRGRIKPYVDWGIWLAICAFCICNFENGKLLTYINKLFDKVINKFHIKKAYISVLISVIIYTLFYPFYYDKYNEKIEAEKMYQNVTSQKSYFAEITKNKENLYLCDLYSFLQLTWDYQLMSVSWKSYVDEGYMDNVIVSCGWDTYSKRSFDTMRRYGTNNIVRSLTEKDNVLLISTGDLDSQKYLVDFLRRHYDYNGSPHQVDEVGIFKIYSFN